MTDPEYLDDHAHQSRHLVAKYTDDGYPTTYCGANLSAGGSINWCIWGFGDHDHDFCESPHPEPLCQDCFPLA